MPAMKSVGFPWISWTSERRIQTAAATAVALLALAGCRRSESAAAAPALVVNVARVVTRELPDEVVAAGAIEAVDKVDAAFFVSGRVAEIAFEDGADVQKDQVLARLDPGDFREALNAAEARCGEIRARHARLAKLRDLGSLTASDFDKIDGALHEAEAGLELARRRLADTELRAPFAGRAVRRGLAQGLVVAPGVPVITVLAPAPVWASVGVSETEARRVQPGQAAQVFLASNGDHGLAGAVETVWPLADPLSRSFTVKIRLANTDLALRPGNVVTARIATGAKRPAVLVPPAVVRRLPDGALFVWTVDPQRGVAVRRIVTVGRLQTAEVEIVSGLRAGESIVLNAAPTLYEGQPLQAGATP